MMKLSMSNHDLSLLLSSQVVVAPAEQLCLPAMEEKDTNQAPVVSCHSHHLYTLCAYSVDSDWFSVLYCSHDGPCSTQWTTGQ